MEKNLYRIHYDLTVQNLRNHRKSTWDDKKTVVANGDATKAIKKLRSAVLHEKPTDDGVGTDKYKNVDLTVRSVERIATVDYA